jgi:hypothetical protein
LGKHPTAGFNPQTKKQPFAAVVEELKKKPKAGPIEPGSPYSKKPSWRLSKAEMVDPFGWHAIDAQTAHHVRTCLAQFEGRTWNDILVKDEDHNHAIEVEKLSPEAKQRLKALNLSVDEVISLRLTGKNRVVGLWEDGILSILWWDPNHFVCKVKKG